MRARGLDEGGMPTENGWHPDRSQSIAAREPVAEWIEYLAGIMAEEFFREMAARFEE
jgi:hypothetical protein